MKKIITLLLTLFIIQVSAQESPTLKLSSHSSDGNSDPKKPLIELSYQGENVFLGRFANLNGVQPEWISSIHVLKGESATTLYGKDGEDGVITIELKPSPETKAYFDNEAAIFEKLTKVNVLEGAYHKTFEEEKVELSTKKAIIKFKDEVNYLENPPLIILKLDDDQLELNEIQSIDNIDTDLIEEINVLKDQESLQLYNAEEKSGIVLVKMKSGKKSAKHFKKLKKAVRKK